MVFKKKDIIYENFVTSLKDLKKIKSYFWFSFFLFFLIVFVGLTLPIFFEEEILNIIRELIQKTEGLSLLELIRFIITNNIQSAFLGVVLGTVLGIFPLAIIVINGYVLGFVANKSIAIGGFLILWRLVPHGILEIPAILISTALGLMIGISMMYNCLKYYNKNFSRITISLLIFLSILFFPITFLIYLIFTLVNERLRKMFFSKLLMSFRIFIFIVVPLLVLAGIIEGGLILLLN